MCQMVTVSRVKRLVVHSSLKRTINLVKLKRICSLNYHLLRLIHILETHQRHYSVWRLLCDSSIDKYYYVDLLIISCNLLRSFNDIIITKVVPHGSLAKATGMARAIGRAMNNDNFRSIASCHGIDSCESFLWVG